ncbi:50S ribosomal protein L31 [Candidatus Providencia siddallii]|uniref:Large ribosomal subunit protein bL31 n=1 Tax=Candidatus Providencia siddallii TaxID=1715285 RepID=A0A0M6W788_9GAMM|nr:50S ribosomal protein L31 [Candidatus Providencia siddallii]
MKKGIHPKYNKISVICSCGNIMSIKSTLCNTLNLDVCSNCHPFYIGKQRDMLTGGRIDRFKKRFNFPLLKQKKYKK